MQMLRSVDVYRKKYQTLAALKIFSLSLNSKKHLYKEVNFYNIVDKKLLESEVIKRCWTRFITGKLSNALEFSSRSQVFYKKLFRKNHTKFTGKCVRSRLLFNKFTTVFSCKSYKIFQSSLFLQSTLGRLLCTIHIVKTK